jgi:hypothetical protein
MGLGKGDKRGKGKKWIKVEYRKAGFVALLQCLQRKRRGIKAELERKRVQNCPSDTQEKITYKHIKI